MEQCQRLLSQNVKLDGEGTPGNTAVQSNKQVTSGKDDRGGVFYYLSFMVSGFNATRFTFAACFTGIGEQRVRRRVGCVTPEEVITYVITTLLLVFSLDLTTSKSSFCPFNTLTHQLYRHRENNRTNRDLNQGHAELQPSSSPPLLPLYHIVRVFRKMLELFLIMSCFFVAWQ